VAFGVRFFHPFRSFFFTFFIFKAPNYAWFVHELQNLAIERAFALRSIGEGGAAGWGGGAVDASYVDAFLAAALTRFMRAAVLIPAVAFCCDTAANDICGNLCNVCRLREEVKERKEREWSRQAHSCHSGKYLQLELSLLPSMPATRKANTTCDGQAHV